MRKNIIINNHVDDVIASLAKSIVSACRQALRNHGSFHIALSGGSTPRDLYRYLARPEISGHIPWDKVYFYFGDERCVPPDHEDSNYRMACESLFSSIAVAKTHIFRIAGELADHDKAAADYAEIIEKSLPVKDSMPAFDFILLGLGPDGHIASLFPDTASLDVHDQPVTAVHVPRLDSWRISITFPVIEHANNIAVLACGSAKADIISQVLGHHSSSSHFPVDRIKALPRLKWYLDRDAALNILPDSDSCH